MKWSLEIWCAMSMIISSPGPPPKIVPAQLLCKVDDFYGKARSYCSRQPDYRWIVGDLHRLSDFERGLTAGAFLDIAIERYGFPAAYRDFQRLYDHGIERLALEYLHIQRLKNLFVRLLKWLCTRHRQFWTWHGYLSNLLDFAEKIMNLTNNKQDLFCATMECLEVVEMPLCFWMFSRLTHDTDKRKSLYYLFETFLYPFVSSRARENAGSLPALLIVKVLFTNCSSRTDDLFANLNEAIIECGKEDPWKLAWGSLVGPRAYAERMARIRSREDIIGEEIRMDQEQMM